MLPIVLVFFFCTARSSAQLTTGTISGSVRNAQSAAIPGVGITLISESRGTRLPDVISSESGEFVILNVPSDTYRLEVAHNGFKTLWRTAPMDGLERTTAWWDVHSCGRSITAPEDCLEPRDRRWRRQCRCADDRFGVDFTGDNHGNLMALRTSDGATLWHENIGRMGNAPITYELDGKQYLLVGGGASLYAFTLRKSESKER
jgi:hypothetical protein